MPSWGSGCRGRQGLGLQNWTRWVYSHGINTCAKLLINIPTDSAGLWLRGRVVGAAWRRFHRGGHLLVRDGYIHSISYPFRTDGARILRCIIRITFRLIWSRFSSFQAVELSAIILDSSLSICFLLAARVFGAGANGHSPQSSSLPSSPEPNRVDCPSVSAET